MEKKFEPGEVILLDPDFLPSKQQNANTTAEANENTTDALLELKKMIGLQSLKQKIYGSGENLLLTSHFSLAVACISTIACTIGRENLMVHRLKF
jgi:hypothetical protein